MSDIYTSYEKGVALLIKRLDNHHPRLQEARVLQARLYENVNKARRYGDHSDNRSERNQIICALNQLADRALGVSFNELILPQLDSTKTPDWQSSAKMIRVWAGASAPQAEVLSALEARLAATLRPSMAQPQGVIQHDAAAMFEPDCAPLPPAILASRIELVRQLCNEMHRVTWCALVAASGEGKTQLARAVSETFGVNRIWWVSLSSHIQEGTAHLDLERQLARWLGQLQSDEPVWDLFIHGVTDFNRLAEFVSRSVRGEGLLVIDNLPDYISDESLFRHLKSTAAVFAKYGTKLLTTSQRDLPATMAADLGVLVSTFEPPPFLSTDILEMMIAAGAPEKMRSEKNITLILGVTEGHPTLVAATVHWLQRRQWNLQTEDWGALLMGQPADVVREQASRRIAQLLDEQPKEFLYRLSLLWEEFDRELASRVAAIQPTIEYPGECLAYLSGPWLERLHGERYKITPLVRNVGKHNLPDNLQKEVHKAAADFHLSERVIEVSKFHTITVHLWLAHDYGQWVAFIAQVALSVSTAAQARQIEWISDFLSPDMEWPSGFTLDLRIILRTVQVRTRALGGGNIAELDADLEKLMEEAGSDQSLALIFANMHTGPLLDVMPADVALRRAIRAVRLLREDPIISEDEFPGILEEMVWFPAIHLRGYDHIRQFLLQVRHVTDEERERLFSADLAIETTSYLVDGIWSTESEKPTEQQDWDRALQLLDDVREVGKLPGADPLQTAAVRARSVILADYLGRPEAAIEAMESFPDPAHPDLSLIRQYTLGCILFDVGRIQDALRCLESAIVEDNETFPYYRFDARRRIAICHSKLQDWTNAKSLCISLLNVPTGIHDMFPFDRLELMGELAWIHWSTGERKRACAAMYGYATGLALSNVVTEPRFREAFNKAGHALGWFSSIASTGRPPKLTVANEDYKPVEAGLFGIRRIRLGDYVPPMGFSAPLLLTQLGALAVGVGLPRMAWRVFDQVDSYLQANDMPLIFGFAIAEYASLSTYYDLPDKVFVAGLKAIKTLAVGKNLRENGAESLPENTSVEEQWSAIADDQRATAERQLMYVVFGPAFCSMLGTALSQQVIEEQLAAWESAVVKHVDEFEDPDYWLTVIQFFREISPAMTGELVVEEGLNFLDEPVLQKLWNLAGSNQPRTSLLDGLRMHVTALDYLIAAKDQGRHMLWGSGRFLHRYWLDRIETRAFALSSPILIRRDLEGISPNMGADTAVKTIRCACRAVGKSLPQEVSDRFAQVEIHATHREL